VRAFTYINNGATYMFDKSKFYTIRTSMQLFLALSFATAALAQGDGQAQTLRDYLAGRQFLVTYRQGGPVYGTYFFLTVNLCHSGNYVTFGQSRKQSVLDSHGEQVNNWRDQGQWSVTTLGGSLGVRYLSLTGQISFYPVRIGPGGQVLVGNGMSVVRQGSAQCP
jgi:hypothetical protein